MNEPTAHGRKPGRDSAGRDTGGVAAGTVRAAHEFVAFSQKGVY